MKNKPKNKALRTACLIISVLSLVSTISKAAEPVKHNWSPSDVKHIDNTINDFMTKYKIPGSSVAIVKDGRLVYSKGYGVANVGTGETVNTKSLFRIASISKSITSVAIMKLVEEGKLNLNDRVFGEGALLGTKYGTGYGTKPYSQYEKAITVEQLLQHTAGGKTWNNRSNDGSSAPMFSQPEMNQSELISWILETRDPSAPPGTTYSYSNFGYCVLGRVIEAVTNKPYETYVQNYILKPMGITSMRIGGNRRADRYPNEVVYGDLLDSKRYGTSYDLDVRRMDAHGGWIASAEDLTLFLIHVDGFSTKPDFLKKTSIETMTTPSLVNKRYAKGWFVNPQNNWSHGGSLPSTASTLVRTHDGLSWAFLMNDRRGGKFYKELDQMMWKAVKGVNTWPSIDLF